jgi:hypothetical protein
MHALAKYGKCHLIECLHDERGPWKDLVGVFARHPIDKPPRPKGTVEPEDTSKFQGSKAEELVRGDVDYLEVLKHIHEVLQPSLYLEIGVRLGHSLRLARCRAVGVDPTVNKGLKLPRSATFVHATSDYFFEERAGSVLGGAPDLVFIDGMHLFEHALRDFMHAERLASIYGLVVIDDVFPNHVSQAARNRHTKTWTGDTWKLYRVLAKYRPDLTLLPLDSSPVGTLLVAGLDPKNNVLWERYNPILNEFGAIAEPSDDILRRDGAVRSIGPEVNRLLRILREGRAAGVRRGRLVREFATLHSRRKPGRS